MAKQEGVNRSALALPDLVYRCLHVVVDAPTGNRSKRCDGAGVGIKNRFVALAEMGNQPGPGWRIAWGRYGDITLFHSALLYIPTWRKSSMILLAISG